MKPFIFFLFLAIATSSCGPKRLKCGPKRCEINTIKNKWNEKNIITCYILYV
ncbi:hypothetical protein Pf1_01091 [Flavobacterium columnare]|nr:hypothetical protein Pf1_01091 [Flavobacterium columnare]